MIVVWRVTERCNLACGFCAYDRRLPFARAEARADQVRHLAPVLADYRRATGDRVLVSWIGGEPLLWKPLFALSRRLDEAFGIAVSTTTNGTALHRPEVRATILAHLSELTVSVDGLAPFHDAVRGWPGGWQRLAASVAALARERDLVKPRFRLRANVVLMHDNLGQFETLCDALAEWGIDEITFNQLGGRDRPDFHAAHRLTPADTAHLSGMLPDLRRRLGARGTRLCGTPAYLERIDASATARPLPVPDCGPGQRFLFIDEHGSVAPCSFTTAGFGVPLDTLRTADDLLALPARFAAMRAQRRAAAAQPPCDDCPSTQVFAKFDEAS